MIISSETKISMMAWPAGRRNLHVIVWIVSEWIFFKVPFPVIVFLISACSCGTSLNFLFFFVT